MGFLAAAIAGAAAYLHLGLEKVLRDVRQHPVDRPMWAREPTPQMVAFVWLFWWWAESSGKSATRRQLAHHLTSQFTNLVTTTAVLFGWYWVVGLFGLPRAWQFVVGTASLVVLGPIALPILGLVTFLPRLLLSWPLHLAVNALVRDVPRRP
jgi:hypothetical protein